MRYEKRSTASWLIRCAKAPLRVFCRACDFYVRSISSCAARVPASGGGGAFYPPATMLPRSFSGQSWKTSTSGGGGDDELRELMRAASVVARGGFVMVAPAAAVPRSQSVAVGRIDENRPCEFWDDVGLRGDRSMFPRSRSHAVGGNRRRKNRRAPACD